jgi:hypothetical protein
MLHSKGGRGREREGEREGERERQTDRQTDMAKLRIYFYQRAKYAISVLSVFPTEASPL